MSLSDEGSLSGRRSISGRAADLATNRGSVASPSHINNGLNLDEFTTSSFDPMEVFQSTRQNLDDDSMFFPKLRATAQKFSHYNPPEPQQHVPTSAVNREFKDFDHSYSDEDDNSRSVEFGRGLGNTPSKPESMRSPMLVNTSSSQYRVTGTPQSRNNRPAPTSLRREAALRRASSKQSRLDVHNPPLPEHVGTPKARDARLGTRSRDQSTVDPHLTSHSFLLPDLPNLTELVSGNYKNGTPIFASGTKSRARYTSVNFHPPSQPNFMPVSGVPISDDDKAILASLQLLKDKVASLEQENAQAARRIEDYENEVIELQAELNSQADARRSDSALGSTDGEAGESDRNKRRQEMTSKHVHSYIPKAANNNRT
jgi:hypothetical protein